MKSYHSLKVPYMYRGACMITAFLILNQGITIQPYQDELPVLKGSFIAGGWTDLGNGLWTTKWDRLFPSRPADWWQRNRSGKETPLYKFNDDMVFIDGRLLQAAGYEGEVDENSFYLQNTLVNSTACVSRSERSAAGDHFGWHPATGPDVDKRDGHVFINNLMYGEAGFNRPLLFVWQRNILCESLKEPQFTMIDNNVYVQSHGARTLPLILWSPAANDNCIIGLDSPAELNRLHPKFSAHSLLCTDCSVFKSVELGNYHPLPSFPGKKIAAPLPAEICSLLKRPRKDAPYVGAYPE